MTVQEIKNFEKRLESMVSRLKQDHPSLIAENHKDLKGDNGFFATSREEMLVFNIPLEDLHKLHTAIHFYPVFMGWNNDIDYSDDFMSLMDKAREYYIKRFGAIEPYLEVFQWFSSQFFGISLRASEGFWFKCMFNDLALRPYRDEKGYNVAN